MVHCCAGVCYYYYSPLVCSVSHSVSVFQSSAEHHESSPVEQDPRGGAGACQNAAQRHAQRPSRCRPDDQGLNCNKMYADTKKLIFFYKMCHKILFLFCFFLWHSDSIFWRRGCHDPAVLWLPLPKGQSAEVPVLQRSPQSAAQTTQGSTTKCRGCIFIFRCTSYEMYGDMYSGELSGQKPNPTLGFILFLLLSESGGVSNPAGADLRVHQPGHGSLRAAQRAADRRGVHQGRVHPPHPARPHACFQAARANSGRTQHSAYAMCVRTFVRKSWVVVR